MDAAGPSRPGVLALKILENRRSPWKPALRQTSYKMAGHPVPLADLSESAWAELTWAQRQSVDDVLLWPLMDIRQLAALRSVPYAK